MPYGCRYSRHHRLPKSSWNYAVLFRRMRMTQAVRAFGEPFFKSFDLSFCDRPSTRGWRQRVAKKGLSSIALPAVSAPLVEVRGSR